MSSSSDVEVICQPEGQCDDRERRICMAQSGREHRAPGEVEVGHPMDSTVFVDHPTFCIKMHACGPHRVVDPPEHRTGRSVQASPGHNLAYPRPTQLAFEQ